MEQTLTEPALAFDGVSFGYRDEGAIDDLTFAINRGEMVGLLGPNGAGKTTVLRLASGALRPANGRIALAGRDLYHMSRLEIAYAVAVVPQEFSVQFRYTVRQLVELGRTPHHSMWTRKRERDTAAVDTALRETSTLELADRVYHDLSGGEKQRVMLALALAQETNILLLDEPTAHLDIRHQIELLSLLQRLNVERGLTVIAAIHDLNLAARYFSRLILLKRSVLRDGPPAFVLDDRLLSTVYETPVQVGILRGEEHLSVLPSDGHVMTAIAERQDATAMAGVHVLAGGGSGELLMRSLADAQITFTAGPLNVGDSDHALAQRLAVLCISEPPYAPVSRQGLDVVRELPREAILVLCPMPLGRGNIDLIRVAAERVRAGCPVLILEPCLGASGCRDGLLSAVRKRDFSGEGYDLYRQILAAGAGAFPSAVELVAAIEAIR